MLFMTLPTAGSHPELMARLVSDCGLPADRVVIVATRPEVEVPDGCVRVDDFGEVNIQRWWSAGIDEAVRRGATAVAVVNDDLSLEPQTLPRLHDALIARGAAIASPSRPPRRDRLHRGPLVPYAPRIWGCLWVLDVNCGLRPDERYRWWYGDCDLDIRARRDHGGVVSVDVPYAHLHSGEGTGRSSALTALADLDALTYQADYARIITLTRILGPARRLFQRMTGRVQPP